MIIAVDADDLDVRSGSDQTGVLFDNLSGYPGNLMSGLDGRIWLGFAKPCNVMIDFMSDKSFLRKMAFAETGDRFNIHRLHAISLGWLPKEKWRLS